MVLLRRLIAQDFKHLDLDLIFPEGILAISGPNESGKSSIFEALLFAFFGRTHKAPRGEKDRLINYDADSMRVQLVFEIEGQQYRVTRRLDRKRPSQATLHQLGSGDHTRLLATGVTNVGAELESLLGGINLNDMLASNVVLQKDLDRLVKLQKMERRHVINAMMGRECFSRVVDKLLVDNRPLKSALEQARPALEQFQSRKKRYEEAVRELEAKQQTLNDIEARLKEASRSLAQTEKRFRAVKSYKEVKDEQDHLQREFEHKTELRQQRTEEIERLKELKVRRKTLQTRRKRFSKLETDLTTFKEVRRTADELDEHIRERTAAASSIDRLQSQLVELEPLEEAATEFEQIQAHISEVETQQRRIMSPFLYIPSIGLLAAGIGVLFANFLVGIVILLCSIPFLLYLGKTYWGYYKIAPRLDELRNRRQELSDQAAKYRSLDHLSDQLHEERSTLVELDAQIQKQSELLRSQVVQLATDVVDPKRVPDDSEASTLVAIVEEVEQRFHKLKAERDTLSDQLGEIESQLVHIKQLEQDVEQLAQDITELKVQLNAIELPSLPSDISAFSETLYSELDQQTRTLEKTKAGLQAERQSTSQRIEELSTLITQEEGIVEEYARKQTEVNQLEENIATATLTIAMLRDVAERGREQVRPNVVQVMGPLLATITEGKYRFPQLSEDYSLKVYSATAGEYIQADLFSGGTEDQFLLALRLGFAITLLPHGRGTSPQFLLLDEPFAGSDVQRRNNIIQLLQDELTKTFHQIIVVSHQRAVLAASEHQLRMVNGRIIRIE